MIRRDQIMALGQHDAGEVGVNVGTAGADGLTTDQVERKAIMAALDGWIRQRPGLEYANYGDRASYQSECRSIARDGREARLLLRAVTWRESITGLMLREAFRAFSGRLSWTWDPATRRGKLEYCTGQYWPTEYRKAAAAVLASALWAAAGNDMPPESAFRVQSWTRYDHDGRTHGRETSVTFTTREAAEAELAKSGGHSYGHVQPLHAGLCAGDWLRRYFVREFGRGLASRWFS
jgi:hypothetical protein